MEIPQMCIGLRVKYLFFLSDFNETWNSLVRFSKNTGTWNLMKILPVGAEFHEDGRTDVTQLIAAFRNFANPSKTVITFVISSSPSSYLLSTILSLFFYVLFILHIVSVNLFRFIDPSNFFSRFSRHIFFLHFISFFIYSCLLRPERKVSEVHLLILRLVRPHATKSRMLDMFSSRGCHIRDWGSTLFWRRAVW